MQTSLAIFLYSTLFLDLFKQHMILNSLFLIYSLFLQTLESIKGRLGSNISSTQNIFSRSGASSSDSSDIDYQPMAAHNISSNSNNSSDMDDDHVHAPPQWTHL
mmetsp:Transcript_14122/g.21251  ORF Transcript_14122/g.21251 Transcript_14122/m.21251 type:complete len:104 (+) Transcript_14122:113-424(+)